ncbi:hypothetical protein H6771_00050 [Candidatus Peribacteria bacterium]|nr:hypothetical protein [Candidatus Peribacteria bacterium]
MRRFLLLAVVWSLPFMAVAAPVGLRSAVRPPVVHPGEVITLSLQLTNQSATTPLPESRLPLTLSAGLLTLSGADTVLLPALAPHGYTATTTLPRWHSPAETITLSAATREELEQQMRGYSFVSYARPWTVTETGTAELEIALLVTASGRQCAAVGSASQRCVYSLAEEALGPEMPYWNLLWDIADEPLPSRTLQIRQGD